MIEPGNLRKYGEYIGLGAEISAAMVIPILIGYYFDNRFNTSPWGILIGIFLGFLGIFNVIYKLVIQSNIKNNGKGDKK